VRKARPPKRRKIRYTRICWDRIIGHICWMVVALFAIWYGVPHDVLRTLFDLRWIGDGACHDCSFPAAPVCDVWLLAHSSGMSTSDNRRYREFMMVGFTTKVTPSPESAEGTTVAFDVQVEKAELLWHSHEGELVSYGVINGLHNQPTYTGHLWTVRTPNRDFGPYSATRPPSPRIFIPPSNPAPAPAPSPTRR